MIRFAARAPSCALVLVLTACLGPDATGLGWIYQYYLKDESGTQDLGSLRSLQDTFVRYQLAAVPGVRQVTVSFEKHRAIVVYDDAAATIAALTDATMQAGYPSRAVAP